MSKSPKNCQNNQKWRRKRSYLLKDLKNVTYDNIKSHKKSGLQRLSRKHNLRKTTEADGWYWPPAFLGLMKVREWHQNFFFHLFKLFKPFSFVNKNGKCVLLDFLFFTWKNLFFFYTVMSPVFNDARG